jgi:photosystem II stability/assembly factor-like uncharacterized protein
MKTLIVTACFALCLALSWTAVRAQGQSFAIQVAAVSAEADARQMVSVLRAKGLDAYWIKTQVPGKGTRYRIRLGRFTSREEAQRQAEQARSRHFIKEFIIADYEAPKETARREPRSPSPKPPAAEPKAKRGEETQPIAASSEREKTAPTHLEKTSGQAEVDEKTKAEPVKAKEAAPPAAPIAEPELGAARRPRSGAGREALIAQPPVASAIADVAIANFKWEIVRPGAPADKNLRAVYFVDSLTGWAGGDAGTLYRTTDGGRTWKPLPTGAAVNITRIHFVNWNIGWMIGETRSKEATEPQTVLLSTTNGGRAWKRQPLPDVMGFQFVDEKVGWAVGRNATLLKTTDGGAQWKRFEEIEKVTGLPAESATYSFGFCDASFIDAERGWVIGNFYGRSRDHIGGLFMTTDGGQTWQRVTLGIQVQHSSSRLTPGLLHSVHFTDAKTGSVTGEMYDGEGRFFFVLHTLDGGRTWYQYRTPSRAKHSTRFTDPAHGWTAASAPREGSAEAVVYDTTLMRTQDGGVSWRQDFLARGAQIRDIFFLSLNKGWAVGDRGMILRYEDRPK